MPSNLAAREKKKIPDWIRRKHLMSLAIQSFILFRNCDCNEYQMSLKYPRFQNNTLLLLQPTHVTDARSDAPLH